MVGTAPICPIGSSKRSYTITKEEGSISTNIREMFAKTSRKIHLLAWLVFDAFQAEILNGQGLLLSTIVHGDVAWHEDLEQFKINHGYYQILITVTFGIKKVHL